MKAEAEKWAEMKPRERDAWVAEHVMGLKGVGYYKRQSCLTSMWVPCGKGDYTDDSPDWRASLCRLRDDGVVFAINQYTADPAFDYEVLRHVRETWNIIQIGRFKEALYQRHLKRKGISVLLDIAYEPGDYSRAAFEALSES